MHPPGEQCGVPPEAPQEPPPIPRPLPPGPPAQNRGAGSRRTRGAAAGGGGTPGSRFSAATSSPGRPKGGSRARLSGGDRGARLCPPGRAPPAVPSRDSLASLPPRTGPVLGEGMSTNRGFIVTSLSSAVCISSPLGTKARLRQPGRRFSKARCANRVAEALASGSALRSRRKGSAPLLGWPRAAAHPTPSESVAAALRLGAEWSYVLGVHARSPASHSLTPPPYGKREGGQTRAGPAGGNAEVTLSAEGAPGSSALVLFRSEAACPGVGGGF